MPDTLTTSAQLLRLADQNLDPAFANDLLQDAPLLRNLLAVTANASQGTQHKYLKHTTAAGAGFRPVNTGLAYSASDQTLVTLDCRTLSANVRVDQQLARAYPGGVEAYMDFEGAAALRAAFFKAEQQFIYGVGSDANGFVGLTANTAIDALADTMVVNATGAAARSSVYLLRMGPEDCELVLGNDGNIAVGETMEQLIAAPTGGELMPIFFRVQEGLMAFKQGGIYSVGRIANIGTAGGTTLTDALLYDAISRFPAGRGPNLIVMNRRSLRQLRASRTATNATGAAAPFPTEVEGIPIVVTDAISEAETAVA